MTERPYQFLRDIIETHKPAGWAIEFGVHSGTSLAMIAEYMPVIGLDSFQGLPEDWREDYPTGIFATGGRSDHALTNNALIVPGWFNETLPVLVERGLPDLGLVHIDCDLYSSTITALEGIAGSLRAGMYGTIIVFDEYHGYPGYQQHEAKAWAEFATKNGIEYQVLATGEQERAFIIRNIG